MPSNRMSNRRARPRPPTICRKPPPPITTPPPPPPPWPPPYIAAKLNWGVGEDYERAQLDTKIYIYEQDANQVTYYYDDANWFLGITLRLSDNTWLNGWAQYYGDFEAFVQNLTFQTDPPSEFALPVTQYPYEDPSYLDVSDVWYYP